MDPLLLYKIIEYIDSYSLITLFNIDPYQTNIQDLIDIQYNTQYINKHIECKKWKQIFHDIVLLEYLQIKNY
jgi:hypothetical protein